MIIIKDPAKFSDVRRIKTNGEEIGFGLPDMGMQTSCETCPQTLGAQNSGENPPLFRQGFAICLHTAMRAFCGIIILDKNSKGVKKWLKLIRLNQKEVILYF